MSDIEEACWEIWQRRGHKHRWYTDTDKYGSPTAYFTDEEGRYDADGSDSEYFKEIKEQLGLVYSEADKCWYDEEAAEVQPGYDEAYGWREVESSYCRDVL